MRVLIELPSWLGDTVMASPAIENLIDFHEQSEVIFCLLYTSPSPRDS